MLKKIAVVFLLLITGLFLAREHVSLMLMKRVMEQRLAMPVIPELVDGLHVGFCGAGSPLPDPERSAPCTLVVAGEQVFLFDVGSNINIPAMGFNLGQIDAVFLTHFHSDHIGALGEVAMQRWVAANHTSPLAVHGPVGVTRVVDGFNMAYGLDNHYRTAHHGEAVAPTSGKGVQAFPFVLGGDGAEFPANKMISKSHTVIEEGDLKVVAFAVGHSPVEPAVGYRVDYKGRSVVISGDTVYSENLIHHAAGADLLVHEGLSRKLVGMLENSANNAGRQTMAKIFFDIPDYHTDPVEAARAAQKAGVKYLAFNHIVPMLPLPGLEAAFLGDAEDEFDGPIRVGKDGDFFTLPAGSYDIIHDNLL